MITAWTIDTWLVAGILLLELLDFIVTRIEWYKEYRYDEEKDLKKQRRTRTTKKTTQLPTGESITEENVETVEHKGE